MASVVHISEAEAARDFAAVLRRVRAGDEVVVENEDGPSVVMKAAGQDIRSTGESPTPRKTAEEVIQAFGRWEAENGPLLVDEDFAKDMDEIHREYNRPMDDRWD